MSAVPFDTLKLADRLAAGGFTPEQARTFASAMAEAASTADLGTKSDLLSLKRDIDASLVSLEQRVTIRFGSMLVIAVGVLLAASRYLPSPH